MTERKTVWKWFWVWDFEKEEEWLNRMAMEGWVLCQVHFCIFIFQRCQPESYTVRIEMHSTDEAYFSFLEETGAEYVGRVAWWVYFRRSAELGPFDLFSDIDSRITHLDRIGRMLLCVGAANICIGIANAFHSGVGILNLLCGCVLMYALGRIRGKAEALRRERTLRE